MLDFASMFEVGEQGLGHVRDLAASSTSTLGATPDDHFWLVIVAGLCMFYMAWGIGANDCANNFGTSWGSGALTLRSCLGIAAVCEFSGAVLLGSDVAKTFRKGIANIKLYKGDDGRILVYCGMTAVLFSAATWLFLASKLGLPVSTTHSAVGGVIAFAVISKGYDAVTWDKVGLIVGSWVFSPVLSMVAAAIMFHLMKTYILTREDSFQVSSKIAPFVASFTGFIIALFIFYKGGKGLGLHKTDLGEAIGWSALVAALIGVASVPAANYIKGRIEENYESDSAKAKEAEAKVATSPMMKFQDQSVDVDGIDLESGDAKKVPTQAQLMNPTERLWCGFCWICACFQALAHGGNDVANSVGPFSAVLSAQEGSLSKKSEVPVWVFVVAAVGICTGLAMYGKHTMETIGKNVTSMHPSKAFCAQLAATFVILIATKLGIPISTTHASVGAVMGCGIADSGIAKGVDWKLMSKIFTSWVATLPVVGIFTAGIYGFLLPVVVPTPILR